MTHSPSRASGRLLTLGLLVALSACASSGTGGIAAPSPSGSQGIPTNQPRDAAADRVVAVLWNGGVDGYVRIEQQEPGAPRPNQHPVTVTPAQLTVVLSNFQIQRGSGDARPLMSEAMARQLADPLAEALARADPRQDVTFAIAGRAGGNFNIISPRAVSTGRVFYQDNRLNVVFGLIQQNIQDMFRAAGVLPAYTPGQRSATMTTDVRILPGTGVQAASSGRGDWIAVGREAWPAPDGRVYATAPAQAPANSVSGGVVAAPAPAPASTTPVAPAPAPAAPPVVAAPPPPASTTQAPGYYESFEQRLATLKRLREQDLITETEYQEKRREILDQL